MLLRRGGPQSKSGLLECPLTDKIAKVFPGGNDGWTDTFAPALFQCSGNATGCAHPVGNATECFAAARATVGAAAKVQTASGASDAVAAGCTITHGSGGAATKAFFNTKTSSTACCGAGVASLQGKASSLVDVEMAVTGAVVTVTLTGPATVWFGVGFFAQAMEDKPYAIIVDGVTGTTPPGSVTERVLASHMGSAANPGGALLKPSITVVKSSVVGGRRTVVLTRPAKGPTPQHASFTLQNMTIPFINAIGSSDVYAHHANKTASSLSLWPGGAGGEAAAACMCKLPAAPFGHASGNIKYLPTGEQFGFINGCSPEPRESVLADRNPTCDVRAYAGGLQVCKHMWSLLDTHQAQPWPDQPLVYYQKYRFYYQSYDATRHVVASPRAVWAIGAFIGEYDVPQCKAGTPVQDCKHEIWGVVSNPKQYAPGLTLHIAAAHFHCHAPTCLAMEIWNNKTGELVCRQEPVYGGTGAIKEHKFDEPGYIAQPPCLWGEGQGLEPMPLASGVEFTIKAITNSTYGHHVSRPPVPFPVPFPLPCRRRTVPPFESTWGSGATAGSSCPCPRRTQV